VSSNQAPKNWMVPVGLFSLGVSIFLLSGFLYGAISIAPFTAFGLIAGGAGLLIAGYWAFRADNIFGGVSFSTIGALFAAGAFYAWIFLPNSKNPDPDISWTLLAVSIVVLFLTIASFKANLPNVARMLWGLLFLTFFVDWSSIAFHVQSLDKVAGVIGIITAIFAWLGALNVLRAEL